jgi:hypothetical protein
MWLRRSAQLLHARLSEVDRPDARLGRAIAQFDEGLPGAKLMRDAREHFDDYADERGLNHAVGGRLGLQTGTMGDGTFDWLDHRITADQVVATADKLLREIRAASSRYAARVP